MSGHTVRIVENIVHTVLGHKDVKIVSAKRVPDKKTPGKNRAIVATLGNRNIKDKVLRVVKQLRSKQVWRHVYIGPDHTKLERERDYHLRVELKRRRDNGEADLAIRKGTIVYRNDKDTINDARVKCVDKVIHLGHLLTENVYEFNMSKCIDDFNR